jgi:dienelactone hydrolase
VALKLLYGLPHDTNISIQAHSDSRRSPTESTRACPRFSHRGHRHLLRYRSDRGRSVCIPWRLAACGRRDRRDVRAWLCHETILQSPVISGYSLGRRLSHPKTRPAIRWYLPKKYFVALSMRRCVAPAEILRLRPRLARCCIRQTIFAADLDRVMKVIEKILTTEKKWPGYLAYPERNKRGPALLLVHQNTGVTDYIKIEALKYAKLGYSAIIPNLYEMADGPSPTHIHTGPAIQARTSDTFFVNAPTRGWQLLLSRPEVDGARVGVIGYCMGGQLGIYFVAATSQVRAFVGYYPTVRDNPTTELRSVHPWDDANSAARRLCSMAKTMWSNQYRYKTRVGKRSEKTDSRWSGTFSHLVVSWICRSSHRRLSPTYCAACLAAGGRFSPAGAIGLD